MIVDYSEIIKGFCGLFVFFVSCVSHAFPSVHCYIVVTCLERADLLALLVMPIVFCMLSHVESLGQVWYFIVSFPDLCWPPCFIPKKVGWLITVNFFNTLLVILTVDCSDFLQHTLSNFNCELQ